MPNLMLKDWSGGRKMRTWMVRSESEGGRNKPAAVCHGCGEPGHIRPNYPNRVKRVASPSLISTDDNGSELIHGLLMAKCVIDS